MSESVYSGETDARGLAHGCGTRQNVNTDHYSSGHWHHGLMHGPGVQVTRNGTYTGEFIDGKYHGPGCFQYTAECSKTINTIANCYGYQFATRHVDGPRSSSIQPTPFFFMYCTIFLSSLFAVLTT
eukprot:gene44069-54761_t